MKPRSLMKLTAATLIAGAMTFGWAQAAETIKIGAVAPKTGPLAGGSWALAEPAKPGAAARATAHNPRNATQSHAFPLADLGPADAFMRPLLIRR